MLFPRSGATINMEEMMKALDYRGNSATGAFGRRKLTFCPHPFKNIFYKYRYDHVMLEA